MIKHLKMKTTKFIISIAFAVFVSISNVNSQVSISYYQGGISKIGIAKTFALKFKAEFRIYAIGDFDEITPELALTYSFLQKPSYNTYIGFGTSYNLINSFIFPLGLEFYPLPSSNKFSIHFELQPTYDYNNGYFLLGFWGMRYKL